MELKTWHLDDLILCCHLDERLCGILVWVWSLVSPLLREPWSLLLHSTNTPFLLLSRKPFSGLSKSVSFVSLLLKASVLPSKVKDTWGSPSSGFCVHRFFQSFKNCLCPEHGQIFLVIISQIVMSFLKHLQCFRDDLRTWKGVHSICKYYAIVYEGFEQLQIWGPNVYGYWHPTKISPPMVFIAVLCLSHDSFVSSGSVSSACVFCAGCRLCRIVWILGISHRSQTIAWGIIGIW